MATNAVTVKRGRGGNVKRQQSQKWIKTTPHGPIMVPVPVIPNKPWFYEYNHERRFVKLVLQSHPTILIRVEQTIKEDRLASSAVVSMERTSIVYQSATIEEVTGYHLKARWTQCLEYPGLFPQYKTVIGILPWLRCINCNGVMEGSPYIKLSHQAHDYRRILDPWYRTNVWNGSFCERNSLSTERTKWMEWTFVKSAKSEEFFGCRQVLCGASISMKMKLCLESFFLFPPLALLLSCLPIVLIQLICRYIE